MTLIGLVLTTAIQLYVLVLVLRVVLDWISHFARTWRPSGIILVACNLVYSLTDPPLRFFGKLIPPPPPSKRIPWRRWRRVWLSIARARNPQFQS